MAFVTIADFILDDLFGFTSANNTKNNAQYLKDNLIDAGLPAGVKALFYQDTAPIGWTIDTSADDNLAYITKGSASGGRTGGTETVENNNSLSGSLQLTTPSSSSVSPSYNTPHYRDPSNDGISHVTTTGGISTIFPLSSIISGSIASSYTPRSANCIICTKDAYP